MDLLGVQTFSGGLDRASARRLDAAWLAQARLAASTRVVAVRSAAQLLMAGTRLGHAAPETLPEGAALTFLGLDTDGCAVFACDLGSDAPAVEGQMFEELRALASLLPAAEAAIGAHAVAMVGWHRRHRYCGVCGTETLVEEAGHSRRCPACQAQHFPRTDPAVIMLVTDGQRCVLGRRPRSRGGMWTVLAGFVEPGETLEEAVVREVAEEVGLRVTSTHYLGSQPWPFPANLMVGFEAHVEYATLQLDDELEEARWFSRDELREALAGNAISTPPPLSIAYHLIQAWLAL